jgi:O-antigen/teichoic acid export membrane protein
MHAIARHSVVNFLAFGVSRLMGLVVVGLVVEAYGLAIFGLLMLVRSFMPGTLFAVFDFGLPDIVARATARDLAKDRSAEALGMALAGTVLLTGVGLLLALPLVIAPDFSARLFFGLDAEHSAMLAPAIVAHGLALPLLFAGVGAQGSLRGQEKFKALSATEIVVTLLYSIIAIVLIRYHVNAVYLALAFLGSHVLRSVAMLAAAWRGYRPPSPRSLRPDFRLLFEERAYLRAVVFRRIGSRLLSQLPRLVISYLLGPGAVGLSEAVLRLPVFLRSVITMINTVVMPVVVRLTAAGNKAELAELAVQGPRLLLAVASLISLPTICLAQPFLHLWLGAEVEVYWPWFAALCSLPLFSATAGFWNAMGRAELEFLRKISRITAVQAVIVAAVALPLLTTMGVPAIWLGMLCSLLYAAPAILLLNARRWSLPPLRLATPLLAVTGASLPAAAFGAALARWVDLDDWSRLVSALAAIAAVQALMLGLFIVRPAERRSLLRFGRG